MISLNGGGHPLSEAIGEKLDAIWVSAAEIRNDRVADPVIAKARKGIDKELRITIQEDWYGPNTTYRYRQG